MSEDLEKTENTLRDLIETLRDGHQGFIELEKNLKWPVGRNVKGNEKVMEKLRQWPGVIAAVCPTSKSQHLATAKRRQNRRFCRCLKPALTYEHDRSFLHQRRQLDNLTLGRQQFEVRGALTDIGRGHRRDCRK